MLPVVVGVLLAGGLFFDTAEAASGKNIYSRMHKALLPSHPSINLSTVYLPPGSRAVQNESQLVPAAKITAIYRNSKGKFEIQSLRGKKRTLALIRDRGKFWLLTAVGATKLTKVPKKALDEVVRIALLLEGDGKETLLLGEEKMEGLSTRILEISYFGQRKKIWVDSSSMLPLRVEMGGVRYDWVYDSGDRKIVRRIIGRNEAGKIKVLIYSDPPVIDKKMDKSRFDFKQTKMRVSFLDKVGDRMGGKPEVMASAGARGLDEKIKSARSKEQDEDYTAVEEMEKVIVTTGEVEEFLREGRLGKYSD